MTKWNPCSTWNVVIKAELRSTRSSLIRRAVAVFSVGYQPLVKLAITKAYLCHERAGRGGGV